MFQKFFICTLNDFTGALYQTRPTALQQMVLSENDDSEEEYEIENEYADVVDGDIVELSFVCDTNPITIFVRATKHDGMFDKLMVQMNLERPKKLSKPIMPGDAVLVNVYGDNSRGLLMNDETSIQLLDIGRIFPINMEKVYKLSSRFKSFKRMAVPYTLATPVNMTDEEKSHLFLHLQKWIRNRFVIKLRTNLKAELLYLSTGANITDSIVEKRLYMVDLPKKRIDAEDVTVVIVENQYISKGFISCVLENDFEQYAKSLAEMKVYGETVVSAMPYTPDKLEICLALLAEDDGTTNRYRVEFQQQLSENRAQIGLIDFAVSAVTSMLNLRKIPLGKFSHECVTIVCKIRNDSVSLGLLNTAQFQISDRIDSFSIRSVANGHEIHISERYFDFDELDE